MGTRDLAAQYGVVLLKADKTRESPEIEELLHELGNTSGGIPFYAIYPGRGGPPITFDGIVTQDDVLEKLRQAGPSRHKGRGPAQPALSAR